MRIRDAKSLREIAGGENHHEKQCQQIPEVILNECHGIHSNPCYKKFTLFISTSFRLSSESSILEKKQRLSNRIANLKPSTSSTSIYPKECNLCKKYRVKQKKTHLLPQTVATINACETIKAAAKVKNPLLYSEIYDVDLIAKEFKYHRHCYKSFTFGYGKNQRSDRERVLDDQPVSSIGTSENNHKRFAEVCEFINYNILKMNQSVSISVIRNIYGDDDGKSKRRRMLKEKLVNEFSNQLLFIQPGNNFPEIIINANTTSLNYLPVDKEHHIKKAAEYLKEDVLEYANKLKDTSWPPTIEELTSEEREPPASVITFLTTLLKEKCHGVTRNKTIPRLIDSFAADMIYGVTHGKVVTSKHYLLALGLHNITGSRKVVEITHKLGHCIDYNLTCEIETAQAKKVQQLADHTNILPLKPKFEKSPALTYFWVDNFDVKVDAATGGGSVNTTHLMAFQEQSGDTEYIVNEPVTIIRDKSRVIEIPTCVVQPVKFNPKKGPMMINVPEKEKSVINTRDFDSKYLAWLIMRKRNGLNEYGGVNVQVVSNFAGKLFLS